MYLSIDLDYWMYHRTTAPADRFFDFVFGLGVPITIVEDHHDLLPDVNQKNFGKLVNIDRHSDVVETHDVNGRKIEFNDGTWVTFVDWKGNGEYVWHRSQMSSFDGGTCHIHRCPFQTNCSGWKQIRKATNIGDIEGIERVGIAISPDYISVAPIVNVLKRLYHMPEGRRVLERVAEGKRDDTDIITGYADIDTLFEIRSILGKSNECWVCP